MRGFVLLTLGVAVLGLTSAQARAQTLDEVTAKLGKVMAEWTQLRGLGIEVESIEALRGKRDAKAQLKERLETLLTKRRSNREWLDYWKQEETFANQVAALYEQLAPAGKDNVGKGLAEAPLAGLTKARDARKQAVDNQKAALETLDADVKAAQAWLSKRAEGAKAAIAKGVAYDKLVAAEAKADAELKEAQRELDEAKAKAKKEADQKSADDKDQTKASKASEDPAVARARRARDKAQGEFRDAKKALTARESLRFLVELGDTLPTKVPELDDAEAKAKVTTLVNATKRRTTILAGIKAAQTLLDEADKALAATKARVANYRARRKALEDWAGLARNKQTNQDTYFKAIDADIAAVNERLAAMEGQREPEMLDQSEKVCARERDKDQTSLEKHSACNKATEQEKTELEMVVGNVRGNIALNKVQSDSMTQLITAQRRDLELVTTELTVAETEWKRSKGDTGEDAAWVAFWNGAQAKARGKKKKLGDAVNTSLKGQRGLKVSLGMMQTDLKNKELRLAEVSERFDKASSWGNLVWALVKTAWEFLRRAYMVPIYLLIAWLLLRLSGNVEEKIVTKARETTTDRDAVQRVETLSTVARGAFKLVIYVATVLMCLVAINVDIGPILGGAAIFGLAISFGSQSLVKDVVTGFFILLEDQYAVGDYISTSGVEGTVEKVTLRRTVLRDLRGTVHTVPNGSITSVSNMSQGWNRVVIDLGVAYGTDLGKVETLVNELGDAFYAEEEWAAVCKEPPRYLGMTKFEDSAIVFRLMFKTEQLANYGADREFKRRLHDAFDKEGIEIPYSRMDVQIITPPGVQAVPAS